MSRTKGTNKKTADPDMRDEYDFTGPKVERGKYFRAYRAGHEVRIHHEDGSVEVRTFIPDKNSVTLAPDVRRHFPDSDAVNAALRSIIALFPASPKKPTARRATPKR